MKKIFAAAAMSLAALFLFTGCSAQVVANISSGWLTDPANTFQDTFYESLDYSVDFENSETDDNVTIDVDTENSSFNITTAAMSNYPVPGTSVTYTNVYHLTMTLTVSATYTYERANGEKLQWTFGGNQDADPDTFAPEDADTVTQEVWFTSADSRATGTETTRPAYSPIRSVLTSRTHSVADAIADDSTLFVSMCDYSCTIVYDESGQNATITYTDNYADLTDEERLANDYVLKEILNFPGSRELSDLQKNYTCIDNAQLFFIARGLEMSEGASNTLTVVSGAANNYPAAIRISCAEPVNSHVEFTMVNTDGSIREYGQSEDEQIPVATMTFSLTNAGLNVGESTSVTYAQRITNGSNTNRCLPLSIVTPYGRTVGSYVYALETASYQAPAEQS